MYSLVQVDNIDDTMPTNKFFIDKFYHVLSICLRYGLRFRLSGEIIYGGDNILISLYCF